MHRHRTRIACLFLAAAAALSLAVPAASSARPRTTVIVRDGTYGSLEAIGRLAGERAVKRLDPGNLASGAMPVGASFTVSRRVVSNVHAMMLMHCHNIDTGENYDRGFLIHEHPEGQAIPRSGRLDSAWSEEDSSYHKPCVLAPWSRQ